jgi:LytS/YehU family sensor histidine kinase
VESLVLEKKTEMASHYIRILAKLFRMVLEHSDNSTVPLQRAVEFLKVYIALEQLRMDHAFEYEVRHNLTAEQLQMPIPSMLIQPYVENSIKYGLGLLQDFNYQNPRDQRFGQLSVVLSHLAQEEKEYIVCVVEDNGVGRARAQEVYATRGAYHQGLSRSTRINEQRLALLSDLQMKEERVRYDDLTDSNGLPLGTRVALHIPILAQPHLGEIVL